MSISSQIVDQRVRRIADEFKDSFLNEVGIINDEDRLKSASFVYLITKTILDANDEDVIDCIVEGGQDFGIDAIYVGPPHDGEFSVTLVQGKYKRDLGNSSSFPETGIKALVYAIDRIFDPDAKIDVNLRLRDRMEEARSLVAEGNIPTVHAIICNNGVKPTVAASRHMKSTEQVTWKYIGPDELLSMLQSTKPVNDTVQLTGKALIDNFDFRRVLIGKISAGQLAALFDRHGDKLLERNIRRYLGLLGNRVNEAVATTLRDENQRSNFYFYNNGITIICSQIRYNALQQENWQVQLDGLQIVNGGQTSKTIQQIVKELPAAASSHVLIRVYELSQDDEELVRSITYATNSQNPVDLRDLKSNDVKQKQLGEGITQLGYVYRRQRIDQPTSGRDLTSAVVAEAVLAVWRQRPHQARFLSAEHFGKLYDIIFDNKLNGAQAVIAAQILRYTENRRKRPPVDAPDFLPYASRFIAMLMGCYLLKDLNVKLSNLDHRTFSKAEKELDAKAESYFKRAQVNIGNELEVIFANQQRTLQRLSAQFRRGDLIQLLLEKYG